MTEAEILAEFALRADRVWDITQWWASVTFAVLLAAHVGVASLNRVIVCIMLILYTLFSIWVAQIIASNLVAGGAAMQALGLLAESSTLTPIGLNLLNEDVSWRGITMILTLGTTYLATIFYIPYSFVRRGGT